ncbi:MAG TPA: DNA primase, partial [Chloroflexota bacterium]|nr:DNA primase [Chloroflexota bacterium]
RGSFRCFGCGKSGDIVTFLMEIEKLDFKEALRRLARKAGMEIDLDRPQAVDPLAEETEAINAAASLYFQGALASSGGADVRAYLQRRGLTTATIERFALGWAPAGWDTLLRYLGQRGYASEALERSGLVTRNAESGGVYDRFRNRLIFPIRDAKGRLTGFGGRELDGAQPKYLNSPETKLFHKGNVLYLLDAAGDTARKAGVIVVVEGYMDALTAHQAGFGNVVASLGTALTDRQLALLYRTAHKVVMALDADAAGQKAVQQTIHLAYQVFERQNAPQLSGRVASERAPGRYQAQVDMTLHVAALPLGVDPDELILADPQRWRNLVDQAKPIVEFFFDLVANEPGGAAERRQRANRELLPVIAEIADPLERGHYVDRLATLLEVPESVIVSAVEQLRRRPLAPAVSTAGGGRWPVGAGGKSAWVRRQSADGSGHEAADGSSPDQSVATADGADDAGPFEGSSPVAGRGSEPVFEATGERSRQRYLLSMLLRYPRMIGQYADRLSPLRPDEERLGMVWDYVLAHPEARTFEDFVDGVGESDLVTPPYLEAILRDTSAYQTLEEARLRVALEDAITLLRVERLRLAIAGCQRELRAAEGEERSRILARLLDLTREKVAIAYNREWK